MRPKPGVDRLRSNRLDGDAEAMGKTDAMLTDTDDPGESIVRSRTSGPGLRPIDHPEGTPGPMGLSSSPSSPDRGDPGPPDAQDPKRPDRKRDDDPQRPADPPAHHHRLRPTRWPPGADPQHGPPEGRPGRDLSRDADRTPGPEPGTKTVV